MQPSSFYHVQLHEKLNFQQMIELLDYLQRLGIEALYCAPIFACFSSPYHIIDPNRIDPRLGTLGDFHALLDALQKRSMSMVLDLVPNHMSIRGDNVWWQDVLYRGSSSEYASFFDINWKKNPKVCLPILYAPLEQVIKEGAFSIREDKGYSLFYAEYIPNVIQESVLDGIDALNPPKTQFLNHVRYKLPICHTSCKRIAKQTEKFEDKQFIYELLQEQFYELIPSAESNRVNYRRFFNINELVALRMEEPRVLEEHHHFAFSLLQRYAHLGLRIDHPDGLYDPEGYFIELKKRGAQLVWAEKILSFHETLSDKWPIEGSVGYEFLQVVSGLFVYAENADKMTRVYEDFIGKQQDFDAILYERRKVYILDHMQSDLQELRELLQPFTEFSQEELIEGCLELMANFPVYRTYIKSHASAREQEKAYVLQAIEQTRKRAPSLNPLLLDFMRTLLLFDYPSSYEKKKSAQQFAMRFQQRTAPVMAKGLEDSTFYIYNRLISLNEVGGYPKQFGFSLQEFHAWNQFHRKQHPFGALMTSSHDSKFSEDMRLRLHALSEIPDEWEAFLLACDQRHTIQIDKNTQYYLYQLFVGLWPASKERFSMGIRKAIREAGVHTSWYKVDREYELRVEDFFEEAFRVNGDLIERFVQKVDQWGRQSALVAVVLKAGSCGIAGIYQGCEEHCLSFVDPDNRREVDFVELSTAAKEKQQITQKALRFRREHKDLFLLGEYTALDTPENVIGFMRVYENKQVVVLGRRFFSLPLEKQKVVLPSQGKWKEVFTGQSFSAGAVELHRVFAVHPFAMLSSKA